MKITLSILIFIFLSSVVSYQEGTIICISESSIDLERPLQECKHHIEKKECKNSKEKHLHDEDEKCKDYKVSHNHFYKNNYKIKSISKIVKIKDIIKNNYFINLNYKPSFRDQFVKKVNYNRLKITYNPILKHIKTIIIRT